MPATIRSNAAIFAVVGFSPARKILNAKAETASKPSTRMTTKDEDDSLHRDRRFDGRMRIVIFEREVAEFEIVDRRHARIDDHRRQRTRIALELLARLLEMIRIEMRVAEREDEFTGTQSANLRDHHRQQPVRGDVERDAEKDVGAALVHLAGEFALGDIELEKSVARRQGHAIEIADIPGADDVAP